MFVELEPMINVLISEGLIDAKAAPLHAEQMENALRRHREDGLVAETINNKYFGFAFKTNKPDQPYHLVDVSPFFEYLVKAAYELIEQTTLARGERYIEDECDPGVSDIFLNTFASLVNSIKPDQVVMICERCGGVEGNDYDQQVGLDEDDVLVVYKSVNLYTPGSNHLRHWDWIYVLNRHTREVLLKVTEEGNPYQAHLDLWELQNEGHIFDPYNALGNLNKDFDEDKSVALEFQDFIARQLEHLKAIR